MPAKTTASIGAAGGGATHKPSSKMSTGRGPEPVNEQAAKFYMIGAVGAVVAALVLVVVINLMGNKPDAVQNRFSNSSTTTAQANTTPQRVHASSANAANVGPSMNRTGSGRSAINGDDPDLEDRMRNYEGMTGVQGWNLKDIGSKVGDPERIIGDYLRDLSTSDRIERYDLVADKSSEVDGQTLRKLYFVVQPYDLVQGKPKKGPRQLLRGVFVPTAAAATGLNQQIQMMREQLASARSDAERASLEGQIKQLMDTAQSLGGGNVWNMIQFGPVQPADPDYPLYMKR
ncbi:MAG: hypothetical protein AB7S36_22615 [Planctomycetota bacterium]